MNKKANEVDSAPQAQPGEDALAQERREMVERGKIYGNYQREFVRFMGDVSYQALHGWLVEWCEDAGGKRAAELLDLMMLFQGLARQMENEDLGWWDQLMLAEGVPNASHLLAELGGSVEALV